MVLNDFQYRCVVIKIKLTASMTVFQMDSWKARSRHSLQTRDAESRSTTF